ncbi:MAG: carboxylating nicotinate-nucleotide diphosphorylase [Candidatus Thermoplasmatota archaeon]
MKKKEALEFIKEDLGIRDITSDTLLSDEFAKAEIVAKEGCIIAGLDEAYSIFNSLGLNVKKNFEDGEKVKKGSKVMSIRGSAKKILIGERTALNFLMRMSGVATATNNLIKKARKINKKIIISATRKTTPGFRAYEKKAVVIGGGEKHRLTLSDAILIKKNHIKIFGNLEDAIKKAKKIGKTEVEVENIASAVIAANANADIIMLDNMKPKDAKLSYEKIKKINKNIVVEVSGGINEKNISKYAKHADVLSLSSITISAKAIDFSLHVV